MKKNDNNKRKVILGIIFGILVLTFGGTFALWAYSKTSQNQLLVAGDIYMKYTGTNNLNVTNATPSDTYNKTDYFEFTIEGNNTYKKDIIYDIVLDYGDDHETRTERIRDDLLKFRLVKVNNQDGQELEEELISEGNYETIVQKRIWIDRILANTKEKVSVKYRLYVWISNETKIGNSDEESVDYDINVWNEQVYASIKVSVNGDFDEKGLEDGEDPSLILSEESGAVDKNKTTTFTVNAKTEGTFNVTSEKDEIATASITNSKGTSTTVTINGNGSGKTNILVNFKPKSAKYKEVTVKYAITVITDKIIENLSLDITDENSITDSDGTIYLSGNNDTINFNYVWYSGKLWRITAINSDKTIKMITQDVMTTISWNTYQEEVTFKDSWIYQWLNEDFKDTLYNYQDIIVTNSKWNATKMEKVGKPSKSTIVQSDVGTLDMYEYTQSYANLQKQDETETGDNSYLNVGYNWWLLTPKGLITSSSTYYDVVWSISESGKLNDSKSSDNAGLGVRPVINLKSDILIIDGGDGSKTNPYKLTKDKKNGMQDDKLNTRLSGEYVNFDGKKYRIIEVMNNVTKLTSLDYIRNEDNSVLKKYVSREVSNRSSSGSGYGSGNSASYWDYYLNSSSGWYGSISSKYKSMLVSGSYYKNTTNFENNYKNSICYTRDTTETTKNCRKNSVYSGYIGLPRIGEIFSSQLGNGSSTSYTIWLINCSNWYGGTYMEHLFNYISASGSGDEAYPNNSEFAVRPSITLNSSVHITSGDGTEDSPYEISM